MLFVLFWYFCLNFFNVSAFCFERERRESGHEFGSRVSREMGRRGGPGKSWGSGNYDKIYCMKNKQTNQEGGEAAIEVCLY